MLYKNLKIPHSYDMWNLRLNQSLTVGRNPRQDLCSYLGVLGGFPKPAHILRVLNMGCPYRSIPKCHLE